MCIRDRPIAGRNFASLELLIPGAQVMAWSQNSAEDFQGDVYKRQMLGELASPLGPHMTGTPFHVQPGAAPGTGVVAKSKWT